MILHIHAARARTLTYRLLIAEQGMNLVIHPNGTTELDWMKPAQ